MTAIAGARRAKREGVRAARRSVGPRGRVGRRRALARAADGPRRGGAGRWIRSISSHREGTIGEPGTIAGWSDFWVGDPAPFEHEPCAFSVGLEDPELEEEMSLAAMAACLGYPPAQFIVIEAGCRGAENHRILGVLALYVAERYSSMTNLGGALAPYVRL